MKTVLFVPGFKQDLITNDYTTTLKAIEHKGYRVVFVPIHWNRTTIDDWMGELNFIYAQYIPNETILAGFSYGAMAAFGVASQKLPAELWLFSLSPYFKEDISLLKLARQRSIGKQRQERFCRMPFEELADKVTCRTLLLIGEVEAKKYPLLDQRVRIASKKLKAAKLIRIPSCDHDVTSAPYINAIQHEI